MICQQHRSHTTWVPTDLFWAESVANNMVSLTAQGHKACSIGSAACMHLTLMPGTCGRITSVVVHNAGVGLQAGYGELEGRLQDLTAQLEQAQAASTHRGDFSATHAHYHLYVEQKCKLLQYSWQQMLIQPHLQDTFMILSNSRLLHSC